MTGHWNSTFKTKIIKQGNKERIGKYIPLHENICQHVGAAVVDQHGADAVNWVDSLICASHTPAIRQ